MKLEQSKWVFKIKYNENEEIKKFKPRVFAIKNSQRSGFKNHDKTVYYGSWDELVDT